MLILWGRSEWAADNAVYFYLNPSTLQSRDLQLNSTSGVFFARLDVGTFDAVSLARNLSIGPFPPNGWRYIANVPPSYVTAGDPVARFLGFDLMSISGTNGPHYAYSNRLIAFPYWFAVFWFMLLPLHLLLKRRRHVSPGCCRKCGYDLRATPGRCPECGTARDSACLSRSRAGK